MENYKIVADSSADILSIKDVAFSFAPLKIITSENEYVDNSDLNVADMINTLFKYKGKSSTSCPNAEDWLDAFGDSENIFCVPISKNMSGCYNTAIIAKELYEEKHPDRKVFVLDTLNAGPGLKLMIEKLCELIKSGRDFDEICTEIMSYQKQVSLVFALESVRNFANNGRINPIIAKTVGLLGIRILSKASEQGEIQIIDKCRGEEKALNHLSKLVFENAKADGKIRISHCLNESTAIKLRVKILEQLPNADIEVYDCRGLCGFYMEKGGILVGYENK